MTTKPCQSQNLQQCPTCRFRGTDTVPEVQRNGLCLTCVVDEETIRKMVEELPW